MTKCAAVVLLSLLATDLVFAERPDSAIRLRVQTATGDAPGAAEATTDVREVLRQQKPGSILALVADDAPSDLGLWITTRFAHLTTDYSVSPRLETMTYFVRGLIENGPHVQGASKIPRSAAADLVDTVGTYAEEQQHVLLARRADWPVVQFEFEELTKESKKALGAKDGRAIVTSVVPEGVAQKAGLRAREIILSVDGKALKSPAELARAIYRAAPGASLKLEVGQRGASRTVILPIP
jgi:PDZ domain